MVKAASRAPVSTGANTTVMVQVLLGAVKPREDGQLLVWMKSPGYSPDNPMAMGANAASPILVSVILIPELVVFTFWLPNETKRGLRLTMGVARTVWLIAGLVLPVKLLSPP